MIQNHNKEKKKSIGRSIGAVVRFVPVLIAGLVGMTVMMGFGRVGPGGARLMQGLGCTLCHTQLGIESDLADHLPDLSYAGLRYRSAYLFRFLRQPDAVRRHIEPARMPDFRFSESEALAIVLFLEQQTRPGSEWPDYPAGLQPNGINRDIPGGRSSRTLQIEDETCLTCHSLNGRGGFYGPELATVQNRLQQGWVAQYLAAPSVFDVPPTVMEEVFLTLSRDGNRLIPVLADPADRIREMTERLFSMGGGLSDELSQEFEQAKALHPETGPEQGERFFRQQNCTACHAHRSIEPETENLGPDLSIEGFRVLESWLVEFLERPVTIRPAGYHPGTGNRMPDFLLNDGSVRSLTRYLMTLQPDEEMDLIVYLPQDLTAFSVDKAKSMLDDKQPCLGCHRLGEEGGYIGPDLSTIRKRLNPVYMYNQIAFTRRLSPETIMPRIVMYDKTLRLIYNYLFEQEISAGSLPLLQFLDGPMITQGEPEGGAEQYGRLCSHCHGYDGNGDGYNAETLSVEPTVHSDRLAMSVRPDDTLFDGIHAGGYILNKSNFMPPFGTMLSTGAIRELVAHIRVLCGCSGPEWSIDDEGKD